MRFPLFGRLGLLFLLLPALLLATPPCCAQKLRTTRVAEKQLPRGLHYQGQLVEAISWTDQQGPQLFAVTVDSMGRPIHDDCSGRQAILYLHKYHRPATIRNPDWERRLYSLRCTPALQTTVLRHTLQVTDLNHDGIGEVWLVYYRSCLLGQPGNPELLMYQNGQAFTAEQGIASFAFDSAFREGPQVFRTHAQRLWRNLSVVTPPKP